MNKAEKKHHLSSEITTPFKIVSDFNPSGDQPEAIKSIVKSLNEGEQEQVLLGVTGSGKTFTMAKVIEKVQKPTLIMALNILSVIMIITHQKHMYQGLIHILKKNLQ